MYYKLPFRITLTGPLGSTVNFPIISYFTQQFQLECCTRVLAIQQSGNCGLCAGIVRKLAGANEWWTSVPGVTKDWWQHIHVLTCWGTAGPWSIVALALLANSANLAGKLHDVFSSQKKKRNSKHLHLLLIPSLKPGVGAMQACSRRKQQQEAVLLL